MVSRTRTWGLKDLKSYHSSVRRQELGSMAVDGTLMKGTVKGEFEPGERTGELDERVQRAIDDEIRIAIRAVQMLEEKGSTH